MSTPLSFSRRGISWRYSPSIWKTDTPFVSARRILPCFVSWQNLKVMKVFVTIVSEKRAYSTRTTVSYTHLKGALPAGGQFINFPQHGQAVCFQQITARPEQIQGLTIPEEQRLLALMHNKLGAQVEILHRMLPYQRAVFPLKFDDVYQMSAFRILFSHEMCIRDTLRSTERVRIPLFAAIASVATNMGLNWVFIYGKFGLPAMGVRGAALATTCAAAVNMAVILILSRAQGYPYLFHFSKHYRWNSSFVRSYFVKCFPILCNEILIGVGNMVINIVLGRQSEQDVYKRQP